MRSAYSSSPDAHAHDAHLRSLSSRADQNPFDRYSGLSQFSDTPSVYSRLYPAQGSTGKVDSRSFTNASYHRDGLERFQDKHISTLDFSDDRSSPSGSTSDRYEDDDDSHSFKDLRDDETGDRMSYLGPKMRFHGLAPWEMGEDTLDEEDEPTESPKNGRFPSPFGGTSSPRPRGSNDSYKSSVRGKRSFDTVNSQMSAKATLYALAQESLSATSLGRPAPRDGLLSKFSALGRASTPTNSVTPTPPSPPTPTSPIRSPRQQRYHPPPPLVKSHDAFFTRHETYDSQDSSDDLAGDSIHPYANPDLIPPTLAVEPPVSPISAQSPRVPPEPWETQRQTSYSTQQSSKPIAITPTTPLHFSTMDSFAKAQPAPPTRQKRASSIQGRGISSPVVIQGRALPANLSKESANLGNNLPGWTDRIVPPSFSLISLEEARAQQLEGKTTSISGELARTSSSSTTVSTTGQAEEDLVVPTLSATSVRSRGRTLSAGAKAKNAIQSMVGSAKVDRRDSEPAVHTHTGGKTVKHKKSGLMRLFSKDKEEEAPPPVPPLFLTTSSNSDGSWKKSAVPRPPVNDRANQPSSTGHKHSPPNLHITTHSTGGEPAMTTADSPTDTTLLTKPWANTQPQSAPANVTSFPALRLRPQSTLFSAHFENLVPELQANASEHDREIDTPPDHMSPITPPSNSDYFSTRIQNGGDFNDNQSPKALREELASSKATSERRIRELEREIRALKREVADLRSAGASYCDNCQTTTARPVEVPSPSSSLSAGSSSTGGRPGVLNRPRAKTATGFRFVNANS